MQGQLMDPSPIQNIHIQKSICDPSVIGAEPSFSVIHKVDNVGIFVQLLR